MLDRSVVGSLELGDLPRRWRKLEYLQRRANAVSESSPPQITRSQVDESRVGGHRLYAGVERALGAAEDCNLALQSLLQHHGATQTAMWALLRTQLEAAFWALWPIDPEDSSQRVLRGIRVEWRDDRQSMTYFREFAEDRSFPFVDSDRRKAREQAADTNASTYRAEAAANGESWRAPPNIIITDELTRLSQIQEPGWGSMLRGTWRSLAGLQHVSAGALLRVSDQVPLEPIAGGSRILISPADEAFHQLASPTVILHMAALARFIECHQPIAGRAVDLGEVQRQRAFWNSL